jgi:hypothetical protein
MNADADEVQATEGHPPPLMSADADAFIATIAMNADTDAVQATENSHTTPLLNKKIIAISNNIDNFLMMLMAMSPSSQDRRSPSQNNNNISHKSSTKCIRMYNIHDQFWICTTDPTCTTGTVDGIDRYPIWNKRTLQSLIDLIPGVPTDRYAEPFSATIGATLPSITTAVADGFNAAAVATTDRSTVAANATPWSDSLFNNTRALHSCFPTSFFFDSMHKIVCEKSYEIMADTNMEATDETQALDFLNHLATLSGLHEAARAATASAKETQTTRHKHVPISLHENELVMKYSPLLAKKGESLKLLSRWSGPWQVQRFHKRGKSCDIQHTITGKRMSTHVSRLARTATEDTTEDMTKSLFPNHEDDLARTADSSRTLSSLLNHFAFISPNRLIRIDEVIDASFCYGPIDELYHPVRDNDRSMWLKPVFIHPETRREAFKHKPDYEPSTSMGPRTDILLALPTFQLPRDFNFFSDASRGNRIGNLHIALIPTAFLEAM